MAHDDFHQLLETVGFAARAHDGQKRKDGKTPCISHVVRVCLIVRHRFGIDASDVLQAALLHDTIEDTTTDFDDLAERFSPAVASWAAALSKDKRLEDGPREKAYGEALRNAPWQVQICKLADVYDNQLDSAHLDAERRRKARSRGRQYLACIADSKYADVQRCWKIVDELMKQLEAEAP
jgi:guanosine-3',5'-bis(diphosphate) 3'-pyrophosphohydrolase